MSTTWQYTAPHGLPQPGSPSTVGGGGSPPEPFFRSPLDANRAMWRQTPEATYPDGYLGTIRPRRENRLQNNTGYRVTQKHYQRGVHRGDRRDPEQYFWPPGLGPMAGLSRQATTGLRHAPAGTFADHLLVAEGRMVPRGGQSLVVMDPKRVAQLQRYTTDWR